MQFVWANAIKDLRRRLRDPVGLVVWIGIPVVILTMLTLAFGGSGNDVKPQAKLLIADEDGSFLSGFLAGAFGQGPMAELVLVEQVDLATGRRRIDSGDGTALLKIPEGFGEALLNETPTRLELSTNPSQTILPGIVEEGLSIMVDAAFYAQRLLGSTLKPLAGGPPEGASTFSDATVAALSVEMNQLADRVSGALFPPLLELESVVDDADKDKPPVNLGTLFFTGMFFMALFFMAQGISDDVWTEKAQGTLRRVVTTPRSLSAWFAGKLLHAAILFGGLGVIGLAAGVFAYDLTPARLPMALVWITFATTVSNLMFTLVQLYASSQRAGSVLTSFITFPLLLLGGSFFPFEAMPEWMAGIGRLTPNGWALMQFKMILDGTMQPQKLALAFVGTAVIGVLLFAISLRRLRRGFIV